MSESIERMIAEHGIWGEHLDHHSDDWRYEVQNGDTRLGYWEWVAARIDDESTAGAADVDPIYTVELAEEESEE